jgi:hypothetical protein
VGLSPLPQAKEDGSPKPTIAIVSYYDTFGIVPSLAVGADSNGSGLISFLELLRLFSRLYKDARTKVCAPRLHALQHRPTTLWCPSLFPPHA